MRRRNLGLYILGCVLLLLFSGCGEPPSTDPCINTADAVIRKVEKKDGGLDRRNLKLVAINYCTYTAVDCMQLLNMVLDEKDPGESDEHFNYRKGNLKLIQDLVGNCGCSDMQLYYAYKEKTKELCEHPAVKAAQVSIQGS